MNWEFLGEVPGVKPDWLYDWLILEYLALIEDWLFDVICTLSPSRGLKGISLNEGYLSVSLRLARWNECVVTVRNPFGVVEQILGSWMWASQFFGWLNKFLLDAMKNFSWNQFLKRTRFQNSANLKGLRTEKQMISHRLLISDLHLESRGSKFLNRSDVSATRIPTRVGPNLVRFDPIQFEFK